MFGAVMNLIRGALARVGLPVLTQVAKKLSTLTRTTVAATSSSIMSAVRSFVGNNKARLLMVLNVLASVGLYVDWSDDEELATGVKTQLLEFRQSVDAAIAAHTGDGKPGSVIGESGDASSYIAHIHRATEAKKVLDRAVQACMSYEGFMAIREAIFMDDEDILAARSV